MEIRIGIVNSPRELSFESSQPVEEISKTIASALEAGDPFFTLRDDKDNLFIVPTAGLAYVQIGSESSRRVGFVA